jgi:hypothetical protein
MTNYSEIQKNINPDFIWIFLNGEQISGDCPAYKDFLTKLYSRKQSIFENENNINNQRKEK